MLELDYLSHSRHNSSLSSFCNLI